MVGIEYSPFAEFLSSFFTVSAPQWAVILLSVGLYWFFLIMPQLVFIRYFDRKLGADMQMRIGPNRVSRFGMFQFLADGLKMFFKEDIRTDSQESLLYRFGPVMALAMVFLAICSIPLSSAWVIANIEGGLLFVVCALVLSQLCLFWASYSVDSGWSVLSSYRLLTLVAVYLVPIVLALLPAIFISGSSNFLIIMHEQGGWPWQWIVFHNPGTVVCFLVLFSAMQIWQTRSPLDIAVANGEIAGGFYAEYSGGHKSLLGLLEYASLFLSCALVVSVFLGAGNLPFTMSSYPRAANIIEWGVFTLKVFVLVFFSIWIRWSLPRLRIDQVVSFSWRVLVPAGFLGVIITVIWMVMSGGFGIGDLM